jgi:lipid-binding SYLF domain-containing protein
MNYKANLVHALLLGMVLTAGTFSTVKAQESPQGAESKTSEYDAEGEQVNIALQAANALEKQMEQEPDKRIPQSAREAAKCIAVFPNVIEFGFIIAGKGGPGMVSCRNAESGEWGPPAIYKLGAASVGLQAGVQSASIILLYLQDEAVDGLKEPKMSFGAGIGIQAGPVGRDVDTEELLQKTAVASYVRSKGLFAGINLEGAKLSFIEERTTDLYGEELTSEQVLFGDRAVPQKAKIFTATLMKLAPPPQSGKQ